MTSIIWLILGALLALPLLAMANRLRLRAMTNLLGVSLVVAALIYIGFAALWGDAAWMLVEALGVVLYGGFYWLAVRGSPLWLAAGWSLHPIWDVAVHLLGPGSHIAPQWYTLACLAFDLAVGAYIVYRTRSAGVPA